MFAFYVAGKLKSISLDFNQAFTQADIKSDVYMEIPAGYKNMNNNYVLKLKKNFYGLSDGNLTWYEHCTKGLKARGFESSKIDPCLFYKEGIVLILYVDDCCIFGTSKEKINEFVKSLERPKSAAAKKNYRYKDGGFDFTVETSIEKFLGVEVSKVENTVTLRQPLLIERIIKAVGFEDKQIYCKPTPPTGRLIEL